MASFEPEYKVGQTRDCAGAGDRIVWEVYQQYEGPWGPVTVAVFDTRSAARDRAKYLNETR